MDVSCWLSPAVPLVTFCGCFHFFGEWYDVIERLSSDTLTSHQSYREASFCINKKWGIRQSVAQQIPCRSIPRSLFLLLLLFLLIAFHSLIGRNNE
jgi:hypothetical protein